MDPRLEVVFFRSEKGVEPVREWLQGLTRGVKKVIGEDIKTVQFAWPIGMPLVKPIGQGLWEVRSRLPDGIARVLFLIDDGFMVLLHGFVKKSQKIAKNDLAVARQRAREYKKGGRT